MSLLRNEGKVKLPFEAEHLETYSLERNRVLIFSDRWDYVMWDGLRNKMVFEGRFPDESEENSAILSIYSFWFTQLTQEKILYYSPTKKSFRIFNFLTKEIEEDWGSASFEVNSDFNFFMWIKNYYDHDPAKNKIRVLHMIELSKAAIDDVYQDGTVTRVDEFDLINANCICEHGDGLIFGTQAQESGPMVIHTMTKDHHTTISFEFDENICPIEFGFIREGYLFIIYNNNEQPDSGIYIINIGKHDFSSDLSFTDKDESVQKIILQNESDPDIFDGRVIIDKVLQTLTLTGMVIYFSFTFRIKLEYISLAKKME